MQDFAAGYTLPNGLRLQIRVGLYTGDVTAAVIARKTPKWTIVGE